MRFAWVDTFVSIERAFTISFVLDILCVNWSVLRRSTHRVRTVLYTKRTELWHSDFQIVWSPIDLSSSISLTTITRKDWFCSLFFKDQIKEWNEQFNCMCVCRFWGRQTAVWTVVFLPFIFSSKKDRMQRKWFYFFIYIFF